MKSRLSVRYPGRVSEGKRIVLCRGDVVWANFGKKRPFVIVSAAILNDAAEIAIGVPLTSRKVGQKPRPHEVLIQPSTENGLSMESLAQPQLITFLDFDAGQVKASDRMGSLAHRDMAAITQQLQVLLGYIPTPPAK